MLPRTIVRTVATHTDIMTCDKCKHKDRDISMQVGNIRVCTICIDTASSGKCRPIINEVLAYMNTYRHQSTKLKMQLACMKFYADNEVIDAKQVLYEEYYDILGAPQNRQVSSNRSKAEKSTEDIYTALQMLDEHDVILNFVAGNIKRLPNFTTEEIDVTSVLERLQKLENRIENVEENCSLISSEQVVTKEKMERVYNVVQTHGNILHEIEQKKQ